MAIRRVGVLGLSVAMIVAAGLAASTARVIPNRFDLAQMPGTVETYTVALEADQATTEELRLYLGDWERLENGEHDWGIPANGARWSTDREFVAGETFAIQYTASSVARDLSVVGTFRSAVPQLTGSVEGASRLDGGQVSPGSSSSEIVVTRSISSDVVTLVVECRAAFQGLVITETFSGAVQLAAAEAAGGRFDTVARSCTGWIALGESVIQLQPGERREVAFTVTTPPEYAGSYWSALFVESPPQILEEGGTRVLSIPRTAIKVFVTAPESEVVSAAVTGVNVLGTSPLTISVTLTNTGNVELVVAGNVEVVDRNGSVVCSVAVPEVKVLPGAKRVLSISGPADNPPLASGIYQATVSLEYGGEGPVVGVRGFRVP